MSKFLQLSLILLMMLTWSSCKIGQTLRDFSSITKSVEKAEGRVGEITNAVVPVDTLMMNITSGLLTELSSADSQEKLDSISARINRILTKYLNETFQNLDPGPIGKKAVQGVLDTLLAKETEDRIKHLVTALSAQISQDLSSLISNLTSPANKAKLNSMIASLLSEANSDAVSGFINRALRNIEFDSLGNRVANELISDNLNPAIDSLVRTAVKGIFDEIKNDDNAKGIFGDIKHILFLAFGLLGLIIGLFFWWGRRKSQNLNRVLINAIEDLDEQHGTPVKKAVEQKARQEGLLPDLDNLLEREHLLQREEKRKGL